MSTSTEPGTRHSAPEGVLGSVQPTGEHLSDIDFSWPLLAQIVALKIGQAMAVRERDVIAVQAGEPLASVIERAGRLCRVRGWVLVLTANGSQETATVTSDTIAQLAAAGGGCLAVGAGRVVIADRDRVLEAADRAGIAVVEKNQPG